MSQTADAQVMESGVDAHPGKRNADAPLPLSAEPDGARDGAPRVIRIPTASEVMCGPRDLLRQYVSAHRERNSPLPLVVARGFNTPAHLEFLESAECGAKSRVVDGNLVITEYPTEGHEAASIAFLCCVINGVSAAGLQSFLAKKGSALIRDRAPNKQSGYQPDQSFAYRLSATKTPSLVLEVGWTETMTSLCDAAKWYIEECKEVQAVVLLKFYPRTDDPPCRMLAVVVRRGSGITEAVSFGSQSCTSVAQHAVGELSCSLTQQAAVVQVNEGKSITLHAADLFYGAKDNIDELLVTLSVDVKAPFENAAQKMRKAISDGAVWPMPDIVVDLTEIRDAVLEACTGADEPTVG